MRGNDVGWNEFPPGMVGWELLLIIFSCTKVNIPEQYAKNLIKALFIWWCLVPNKNDKESKVYKREDLKTIQ